MTREQMIQRLAEQLAAEPTVHALWLEGADATGHADAYSDIDFVADVEDGSEGAVFALVEATLGNLDLCYERPSYHKHLRTRFYHVAGTPDSLLIDFTVQSHSREFTFVIEDETCATRVLFDKSGVVRYEHLDEAAFRAEMAEAIPHLEAMVRQKVRAAKYTRRGQFLEALAYYQRYVLGPLVQVLRMKYAPLYHEHFLIHISRHLPAEAVQRLEALYRPASCADMAAKIEEAAAWFWETVAEVIDLHEQKQGTVSLPQIVADTE